MQAKELNQLGNLNVCRSEYLAEINSAVTVNQFVPHPSHRRPGHGGTGLLEIVTEQLGDLANQKKLVDDRGLRLGISPELLEIHPASELPDLLGGTEHVLQEAFITLHKSVSQNP
ncbi:MAG TPA: hypothetical protein PKH24_02285 [Sedimentisphaerales bacterium]|nr:hypothetical protein [Sedimentisphaerales bacterium]HNU28340.1 hypothetical protein [Sedimentisphaerales bacterium]